MKYLFLILVVVHFGCGSYHGNTSCTNEFLEKIVIPTNPDTQYFPFDSLYFDNNQIDSSIKITLSKILFDLKEPVLSGNIDSSTVFRLLWVPAKEAPVIVRITKCNESTVDVTAKKLDGIYNELDFKGYKLSIDTTFKSGSPQLLSYFEQRKIQEFFKLGSSDSQNWTTYKDVTTWVLECNDSGKFHCINRFVLDHSSTTDYTIAYGLYEVLKDANVLHDER